ncbi:hypothetical protein JYU02_01545 [bacterium AH-315-P15]|nr:hypothetical protein [bacterium AH-315-P15]
MHAVNHAITALAIKKAAPAAPLAPLLISVQTMEILWVGFHFAGLEWTEVADSARSIADVSLAHMPWSHSVLTTALVAVLFGIMAKLIWKRWVIALALAIGVLSHIALDLLLHAPDVQMVPWISEPKYGLGFYGSAPAIAWVIELAYGLIVWRMAGGGKGLLALVVLFNAAAFTSYMPFIGGEMNPNPMDFARFVGVQIAVTLPLIYFFAPKWMRQKAQKT